MENCDDTQRNKTFESMEFLITRDSSLSLGFNIWLRLQLQRKQTWRNP